MKRTNLGVSRPPSCRLMSHYAEDLLMRTIVIFGITGRQGGAFADALLTDTEEHKAKGYTLWG